MSFEFLSLVYNQGKRFPSYAEALAKIGSNSPANTLTNERREIF